MVIAVKGDGGKLPALISAAFVLSGSKAVFLFNGVLYQKILGAIASFENIKFGNDILFFELSVRAEKG